MRLGIDIGSSKVAAVIVDADGHPAAVTSVIHRADLPATAGCAEQDVQLLLNATWQAVTELPAGFRRRVRSVGFTGQMHGTLLIDSQGLPLSPLITWQDGRCLEPGFLQDLSRRTLYPISSGFGCATLAYLASHGMLPQQTAAAATIHDYATAILSGQTRPLTDPTDAASWGLFDLRPMAWDITAVLAAGIDPAILPTVMPSGSLAGTLAGPLADRLGLPAGIPLAIALGDNQASLLATLKDADGEIAITIGTGAQVSAVLPKGEMPGEVTPAMTCEFRPYRGGRYMITAAALCGGSAWAWLARTVACWQRELGLPTMTEDDLYASLNALGMAAGDGPLVAPHFLGERHNPALRASITQLRLEHLPLGELARGLARGIVTNLRDMLPPQVLAGRQRLVGSGNALRRNPLLAAVAEDIFGLPMVISQAREEAALGAALHAGSLADASAN